MVAVMTVGALMGSTNGAALLVDEAEADKIGPGLVAFTIVVLLGVATFFLIRSMLHHIGKVPPSFDDDGGSEHEEGQESSGSGASQS